MNRNSRLFILLNQKRTTKKKTVKISQEPPVIVYFEKDILEDTLGECIFDPFVTHDDEKDHPDLLKNHKPWQKAPYTTQNGLLTKIKSIFQYRNNLSISAH